VPDQQQESVSRYQAMLSAEIHPLRVELRRPDADFESSVEVAQVGGLRLASSYASSACHCSWEIGHSTSWTKNFRLQIQEEGETTYYPSDRSVRCTAGSLMLVESGTERAADQPGAGRSIHVTIPRHLMLGQDRHPGGACFAAVEATRGSPHVLRKLISDSWEERDNLSSDDQNAITSAVMSLVNAVFFGKSRDSFTQSDAVSLHFQRIHRAILQNICETNYSISDAASDLKISKRYIQAILTERGVSFRALLLNRRLEAARNMLKDPAATSRSITEIALICGFNELSHFSRCFSREFGASPREFRLGQAQLPS